MSYYICCFYSNPGCIYRQTTITNCIWKEEVQYGPTNGLVLITNL